jgi:PTS system ascorbate-specific IIA component
MAAILIVAHAPLGSGFVEMSRHFETPDPVRVRALDVPRDEPRDETVRAVDAAIEALAGDDVLVLTDAKGGTPCNVAHERVRLNPRARIVCGLNLPMLWRAMWNATRPLEELAKIAEIGGAKGIEMLVETPAPQNQTQAPPRLRKADDQEPDHHQQ